MEGTQVRWRSWRDIRLLEDDWNYYKFEDFVGDETHKMGLDICSYYQGSKSIKQI